MKRYHHRLSAAALTLIVCLSISPIAAAAQPDAHDFRESIVRILKKIQKKATSIITVLGDTPGPPKP
jgi:hypothetical protein